MPFRENGGDNIFAKFSVRTINRSTIVTIDVDSKAETEI